MDLEKYIDMVYEKKEVTNTYKIYDYEGNKKFWDEWKRTMRKTLRDSDCEINWEDCDWFYKN